jgi:hypothetical protein
MPMNRTLIASEVKVLEYISLFCQLPWIAIVMFWKVSQKRTIQLMYIWRDTVILYRTASVYFVVNKIYCYFSRTPIAELYRCTIQCCSRRGYFYFPCKAYHMRKSLRNSQNCFQAKIFLHHELFLVCLTFIMWSICLTLGSKCPARIEIKWSSS